MDEGMERETEEQRRKPKRGSDDDDDGALRCKSSDGNFSCWTKGTKQMYVCVSVCVCVCVYVYERDFSGLLLLLSLWGTVIVIHALLKSTAHWDQHEDTHTLSCLVFVLQWSNEDITHTWTSAVTLPGLTLCLLASYKSGSLASFPASILLPLQQRFSPLSLRLCSTELGLRGEPFLRLSWWEVTLLHKLGLIFVYCVVCYNWTERVIMEKLKRYIFHVGFRSCSYGLESCLSK